MGFWFATTSDWIEVFGNKILEAEVDLGISYNMSVKELFLKSSQYQSWDLEDSFKERELWLTERQKLLDEGFSSVAIVEGNNKIAMYVVLSSEKILSFKVLSDLNRQMTF